VQFIYKKFVRKDRDPSETTVVYSPETVEMPIPRGLAGPGMLADTIVRRWQDHQPLNRLEGISSACSTHSDPTPADALVPSRGDRCSNLPTESERHLHILTTLCRRPPVGRTRVPAHHAPVVAALPESVGFRLFWV